METDDIIETNPMWQWKLITIVDTQLNRVFNWHSHFYAYQRGQTVDKNNAQLVRWLGLLGHINKNLDFQSQAVDDSFRLLCGPDFRSSIGHAAAMVGDVHKDETDALLKRYQSKYDRVKQHPDIRTCDALEAESEALIVDLSLMKQQSQALEAAYDAKFQNLVSELKQKKEKLRQFVEQERIEKQQQEKEDQDESQQNDGQIGMPAIGTAQSAVGSSGGFQADEDCRPLSPLSPVKIDEPLSLSLYSDNHIASWNFPAWAKTKGIPSANGAVDQLADDRYELDDKFNEFHSFEDTRVNKPFNARITPKTYSSKGKRVQRQLSCDSSTAVGQKNSIPLAEGQVDSNAAIRCNEVLMDWPEGKNDFFMKNSNDLGGAAHAIEFAPIPDTTTPKLKSGAMLMKMSVDNDNGNGSLMDGAISSSCDNNHSSADNRDYSDDTTNEFGLFVDPIVHPLQHRPLEDNGDYPVHDVANRRIVEIITIDDSGSDSDVEIVKEAVKN